MALIPRRSRIQKAKPPSPRRAGCERAENGTLLRICNHWVFPFVWRLACHAAVCATIPPARNRPVVRSMSRRLEPYERLRAISPAGGIILAMFDPSFLGESR